MLHPDAHSVRPTVGKQNRSFLLPGIASLMEHFGSNSSGCIQETACELVQQEGTALETTRFLC